MVEMMAYEVSERHLEIGGFGKMFFRDYVPAVTSRLTPLLCIGGYWRNSSDFERLARCVAGQRRLVAPDLRGRGKTARATDVADYHFDKLVADMWALLDHLEIERVVTVGMVLGGFIGLEMAAQNPSRVAGIVLNDIGTETTTPGSKGLAHGLSFNECSLKEAIDKVKNQHGKYLTEFTEDDWRDFTLQGYARTESGNYVRAFDELTQAETHRFKEARPSFWKEFTSLQDRPIALLRGEFSEFVPPDLAERMAGASPHTTVTTIAGRGHWPMLDEPASLAAIGGVLAQADRMAASGSTGADNDRRSGLK
ncbi:alpha/beta hydrolase [Mesorhizobium sp. B3-1-3]|uniref:alpha/beta fold hydrolase n=1 Tax=unclassified Mesorhizobium TaxID=325217 RepID=UPI00112C26D7|nr:MULTISPECIES: alpha/beta hydrolase [unclassified Mesorhizobium]TPI57361.1 alpha/beta hydrolase [Mesorhizobium sp. B3-1-8]TPI63514.1 alpha/beta hydrolase [Mesorhizobium sp. B3-1-3]